MELDYEQTLTPYFGTQQSMKVSPRLVVANYILELSSQELQEAIAHSLVASAYSSGRREPDRWSTSNDNPVNRNQPMRGVATSSAISGRSRRTRSRHAVATSALYAATTRDIRSSARSCRGPAED
jgi:hypothetical protein